MKIFLLLTSFVISVFAVTIGEVPKQITIAEDNGGYVKDSSAWNSSMIKDKVYVMFYVDPDEKDTNEDFSQALKAKKFDETKFGSIAMINMAATWKPNFIISEILKGKQKDYPHTIYVKDKASILVNEWELADNNSDILIFSKTGKLLYYKAGKLDRSEINSAIKLIENNL